MATNSETPEPPSWEELGEKWAHAFLAHIKMPGNFDKDKNIRPALLAFILANKLFEKFVKLGIEIGEEHANKARK